jgi:hypothetical protein
MALKELRERFKKEFTNEFVLDVNEMLKQALPSSDGWEHGTNARPFIKQMTEAKDVLSFLDKVILAAYFEGIADTQQATVESLVGSEWVELSTPENYEAGKLNISRLEQKLKVLKGKSQ